MSQYQTIDQLVLGVEPTATNTAGGTSTYITQLLAACHSCAKAAQALPTDNQYEYLCASAEIQEQVNALQSIAWTTITQVGASTARNTPVDTFQNTRLLKDKFQLLSNTIDDALEVVNTNLRYMKKTGKNEQISAYDLASTQLDSFSIPVSHLAKGKTSTRAGLSSIDKPQNYFEPPVDNSYTPFRPLIRSKPNALVPLDPAIISGNLTSTVTTPEGGEQFMTHTSYPHPYAYEITNIELLPHHVEPSDVKLYEKLTETPCFWIDTVDDLHTLERTLLRADVFAIDVEHHSHRTYQGIVCLLQISTQNEDFLIDTIALRSKLHILNSSFTNPRIVKVLHGCNLDVIWLQRDLGLYLVNIFDTGQASRLLDFKKFSLATLLDHYCNIHVDKQYQTADWRVRPLNREMLVYAREDTHYLIYIYQKMKNELIYRSMKLIQSNPNAAEAFKHQCAVRIKDTTLDGMGDHDKPSSPSDVDVPFLLGVCINRSNSLALATYEKDNTPELTAIRSLYRASNAFSDQQRTLYVELFKWRDRIARQLDESTGFILKQDHLIKLCKIQPKTMDALMQTLRPISIVLQPFLHEVLQILTGIANIPPITLEMVQKAYRDHHSTLSVAQAGQYLTPMMMGGSHMGNMMGDHDHEHDEGHDEPYVPYLLSEDYHRNISAVTSADGDMALINPDTSMPLLVGFKKEQLLQELGWDTSSPAKLVANTTNMMEDIHKVNKKSAEHVLQYAIQQYSMATSSSSSPTNTVGDITGRNGINLFDTNGVITAFKKYQLYLDAQDTHNKATMVENPTNMTGIDDPRHKAGMDGDGDQNTDGDSNVPTPSPHFTTPRKRRDKKPTMFDSADAVLSTPHRPKGQKSPISPSTIRDSLHIDLLLTPKKPKYSVNTPDDVATYANHLIQAVDRQVTPPITSSDVPLDENQRRAIERYGEGVQSVQEMGLHSEKSSVTSTPQTSLHSTILSPEHSRIVENKKSRMGIVPTHLGQIYKQANINRKQEGKDDGFGRGAPTFPSQEKLDAELLISSEEPIIDCEGIIDDAQIIKEMTDEDTKAAVEKYKQKQKNKPTKKHKRDSTVNNPNLFLMADSSTMADSIHNPFLKNTLHKLEDTGYNPNQLRPNQYHRNKKK